MLIEITLLDPSATVLAIGDGSSPGHLSFWMRELILCLRPENRSIRRF